MKRLACVLLLLALAAVPVAAEQPGPQVRRDASGGVQIPVKEAPLLNKLDRSLNRVVASDDQLTVAEELGFRVFEERIQVIIDTDESQIEELKVWLDGQGALLTSSAGNLVQSLVRPELLPELSNLSGVNFVSKPIYARPDPVPELEQPVGAPPKLLEFTTEGLQAMNGDMWHSAGFLGQGVTVAIIDSGFLGVDALLGSELPDAQRVHAETFGLANPNSGTHGTSCAEIIYDVVPNIAGMYLFAYGGTKVDAANAFTAARDYGIDVVSFSQGWLSWGPNDGTGVIADAIDAYVSGGGVAVVSAGNERLTHWQGYWNDPDSDGLLDFSHGYNLNFLTVNGGPDLMWVPAGNTLSVSLIWNQWNAPQTDLDLYLYGWDGVNPVGPPVAASELEQSGLPGQQPVEEINYTVLLGGYFGVAVSHYSGPTNVSIEFFLRPDMNPLQVNIQDGSLMVPSDTEAAIGVAALDVDAPYLLESYSSKGPTNGPGGSLTGGRVKPDISGFANVSTASSWPNTFGGTSAACPHVAGAAALVWSAYPSWSGTQIRNYLQSNADEMGPGGKDNDYGYGRLLLGDPPSSCTYSISPTSATYGASGGSGSFSVSTQAGCTWTATSNNGWIHITAGASGTGNGSVSYSVDANGSSSSRTGTISAAGKTFTITQSGSSGCNYSISPTSQSFGPSGGNGSVSVSTTAGCSWTASSNNGWIHVTSGSSGTGSGTVNYSVDANTGGSRTGTMTIAGETFTVTQSGGGGGDTYTYQVAGVAHAGGAGGSVWRSTLCVTNRSGSTANLTLVYRMASNSVTRTHVLQNGRIKEWADVAVSLFNQSGNTSGAIEIISDAPVMVVARTYNEAPDGTFGQGMPGNDDSATLAYGQMGVLPQLKKTSAFRTNVGLMNHGAAACNVRIKLFSETGSQIGNTIDTSVPAKQWKQINDVFNEAGVGSCSIGYATVEVRTAGGKVWAYGSVVDNGTGDPTTISLFIE